MRDNYDSWLKTHPPRKPVAQLRVFPEPVRESAIAE
jgi:hypothetical protein